MWMLESKCLGMEHLAREVEFSTFYLDFGFPAVSFVSEHRMADCRKVYAYLVSSSGAEHRFDEGRLVQSPEHLPACDCFLASFCPRRHFFFSDSERPIARLISPESFFKSPDTMAMYFL